MKYVKTFEAQIKLSKDEMEILHKKGQIEKDGHIIYYNPTKEIRDREGRVPGPEGGVGYAGKERG